MHTDDIEFLALLKIKLIGDEKHWLTTTLMMYPLMIANYYFFDFYCLPGQTLKCVTGLGKAHQSHIKFAPKCTNKAKNLHHWWKNHSKENHNNKASNKKRVGQLICAHFGSTLLTPTGKYKGGYWLRRDLQTTLLFGRSLYMDQIYTTRTRIMWTFAPICTSCTSFRSDKILLKMP